MGHVSVLGFYNPAQVITQYHPHQLSYQDIVAAVRALGFDCAYREFNTPPKPPYCVVIFTHNRDVVADNQNYVDIGNYQVELYHNIKHPPSEKLIQNKLKELRLPYTKAEVFLPEEKLYQVIYEIQLIGG